MKSRIIVSVLLFSISTQSACIHTSSTERASVELLELGKLDGKGIEKDNLRIEHLIYSPAKLPLEDFFERLMAGEFKESFQRINLLYSPATTDDKVLHDLLNVGLIPVYIRMKNNNEKSYAFTETDFILDDGTHLLRAIPARKLPRVLKRFHLEAVGANIYNTGVVVLTVAAVMAIIVLSAKGGSTPMFHHSDSGESNSNPENSDSKSENQVYNETTKLTYLDYKNYLLTARTIAPGESEQGLLFFEAGKDFDKGNIHFGFKGVSIQSH